MKSLYIIKRKIVERQLLVNPNSKELQKQLRWLTITINFL